MKKAIIVGSGIAGLIAALKLSEGYEVTLVTKAALADSNTRWAQGGIAAATSADDSVEEHIADTLRAGAGLCNLDAVRVLCSEGPQRIGDLLRLGVAFDTYNGALARGLEAAHSRPRVLHAGGDATGLSIELALVHAVRGAAVQVIEHTFASDLVLEGEAVRGLKIFSEEQQEQVLDADVVVLASGGAGQLYRFTTNPAITTGDGVAMAMRAGAEIADVEFYQFHPTMLAAPSMFLISEAVRGEGAVLLDRHGRRFMHAVHPAAELAPRDVVARGIARQMAAQDGAPVLLDATKLSGDFLAQRFPSIDAVCRRLGLDWAHKPIPITPAAHYWMGGVRTDLVGRTSVPGLYAVGEVACTGVHGANRLASNSLLESLVFAWRCAEFLLEKKTAGARNPALSAGQETDTMMLPIPARSSDTIAVDRGALQDLMWSAAGIERDGDTLRRAAARLRQWHSENDTVEQRETANLLMLARTLVAAALTREESRGAHFRTDFPGTSSRFAHSLHYRAGISRRELTPHDR